MKCSFSSIEINVLLHFTGIRLLAYVTLSSRYRISDSISERYWLFEFYTIFASSSPSSFSTMVSLEENLENKDIEYVE